MATFHYRRRLTHRELVPAAGVGLGVGVVVAYLTQLFLRKTRVEPAGEGRAAQRP